MNASAVHESAATLARTITILLLVAKLIDAGVES